MVFQALFFHNCNGLRLSNMKHINSGKNHISINVCNDVIVSNIYITAPDESPNTDGIDISRSNNVLIKNSFMATGNKFYYFSLRILVLFLWF